MNNNITADRFKQQFNEEEEGENDIDEQNHQKNTYNQLNQLEAEFFHQNYNVKDRYEEEEKTIASTNQYRYRSNTYQLEIQIDEKIYQNSMIGSSSNPSSSHSGKESSNYEGQEQIYPNNKMIKRDSLKQQVSDNQQFQHQLSRRQSVNPNQSIPNYSQFCPKRSSLMATAFPLQIPVQEQFQSQFSNQKSLHSQNRKNLSINGIKNHKFDEQNQAILSANTSIQNFQNLESSVSLSRSKKVIKISKDKIEARVKQQLLQAQTLGSISSTNSFDDSPITKINRRGTKLYLLQNHQSQKGTIKNQQLLYLPFSTINDPKRVSICLQEDIADDNDKFLMMSNPNQASQMSQIKSKNQNTLSEASICGNTVFEENEDVLSGVINDSDQEQTQQTITENNITEQSDSSNSSSQINTPSPTDIKNIKQRVHQFYTEQCLDKAQRKKKIKKNQQGESFNNKYVSKTIPSIDDYLENEEEIKFNDTVLLKTEKQIINVNDKKEKKSNQTKRISKDENQDQTNKTQFTQDRTEFMYKSNHKIEKTELIKNHSNQTPAKLIDSRSNTKNHSNNLKVVENHNGYGFNPNQKVSVEDYNIGLVYGGDLKRQENKEKIRNILLSKQYGDLLEIGSGSYGLVLRATTPEGYIRALKIHYGITQDESAFLDRLNTLTTNSIMAYNTFKFRDTVSKKQIEVIEMELADGSLKNQVYADESEISDEKYRQICIQLIVNVLSMHNMCVVHRDLKLDNILVSNGNYFLADFGISEEIGSHQLIQKFIPGTDCFSIKQNIAGTQLYFSPIIRDAHSAQSKKYIIEHDPFKSDLYTVGLILLEIELVRQKYHKYQILQILRDKHQAYKYALKTNINKYLIKDNYYILKNNLYQPINILAELLQIEEVNRISSIKLCLICQLDKIILSNIIVPHHKIFPPIIELKQDNTCIINYTIKLLIYEGSYIKMEDGRILRHGEGSLYKLIEGEREVIKALVYEGQWDNDLPHGQGVFYFFQNDWVYEGQFRNGQFFGEGSIKFIDWVVYKGTWYNFLLENFLIPVSPTDSDLFLQKDQKNVEVLINTHDREGYMRSTGLNEVELQFEINTFRFYSTNLIEFKQYLKDKQRVKILLTSKKSKHDFQQSSRQQLVLLAVNRKKKRIFEVYIKYFKHELILDAVILDQLIQLLNQPSSLGKNSSDFSCESNKSNIHKFQSQIQETSLMESESNLEYDKFSSISSSIQNSQNQVCSIDDSDSIIYLNFDLFSKESAAYFFDKISNKNDPSLSIFKLEYMKNIGVSAQIEEESLIKFLLSKQVQNLKELDLSSSKDISSSIFVALDHNIESLKMLNLKYEALSKQTFLSLFKYPFLKQIVILDFSYSEFDDDCMLELVSSSYLNNLQTLIFCFCRNLTYKGLETFFSRSSPQNLPLLTHLDFEGILSKGYHNMKNDKILTQIPSNGIIQNTNYENIHQTEQEMLLAFDRKHHLYSNNSNLTVLDQKLVLQPVSSTASIEGANNSTRSLNKESQSSLIKQNAYFHYFPYTTDNILKQLEYIQKQNILRKNLVELNQSDAQSSLTSCCNITSVVQISNSDETNSQSQQQEIIKEEISDQNIKSQQLIKATFESSQTIAFNTQHQAFHSSIQNLSQKNLGNSQSPRSNKSININQKLQSKQSQTSSFFSWVNKLTDKNLQALEKFSKQTKLFGIHILSFRATNIDDTVLKNLAKNSSFIYLKFLDISQCQQISSEGFESLIQSNYLKNLIKIDISQTSITCITSKPQQVFLQSLNIVECPNISPQSVFNYLSNIQNQQTIRHLYIDIEIFFITQIKQSLLECQKLENIHIFISSNKIDFYIPNPLTLNLLIEKKGYKLNFYSSKLYIQSIFELVKGQVIQCIQIKKEQLNQIYINGINYVDLNRFDQQSTPEQEQDTIQISRAQMLDIPSKNISFEQLNDENIIEDLRKLFNSRNFLLIKQLDISRLKVNSYAGQLLAGSRYTRSLTYIDLSYSTIIDEDLDKLSKSKYLPQLQIIKLNCCKDITEKGINYLLNAQNNLENLKSIEVKQRLLNIYLLYSQNSEKVQIIADQILFKSELNQLRNHNNHHKVFQLAKYWTKIFRDNMENINSIEILGFDENIIDYFLTHITSRNRVKRVIIDFSKKNQKIQSQFQIQNINQFQRINHIFSKLPDLQELRLDFSGWSDMTDLSIKEFCESIVGLQNLKVIDINLSDWAKKNEQITDLSCMFLGEIFQKIQKINVVSLDLSNWGDSNCKITDKSIVYLKKGILCTKDYLTYLSLNLNSWGPQMTNISLLILHDLVRELNLLSFLKLGLQEWGKDNSSINDDGIESLAIAIGNSRYLNQLEINLAYAATLNSGIGDVSVQNLAKSLMNINSLSSLKINLGWWMVEMNLFGFSTDVSDECIKDLATAIGKLKSLTELDLNFDRWGYKNKFIKDESIINLAENIENLYALNSLSLNFDWWGLGNEKITDKSLVQLANKVTKLSKLTTLRLFLSLDRWKKIEEKHIECFKEKILTLKTFNKNITIDIK
ncbi:hypothetical protein ABPG72_006439 [Tetrahymena utriculariae]